MKRRADDTATDVRRLRQGIDHPWGADSAGSSVTGSRSAGGLPVTGTAGLYPGFAQLGLQLGPAMNEMEVEDSRARQALLLLFALDFSLLRTWRRPRGGLGITLSAIRGLGGSGR